MVDDHGHALPGSIAVLEPMRIGGVTQWLLIRGRSRSNPVLLFVHGGPGLALMPLAHKFQRELENDFVVVQWDQRGSGKSHDPRTPGASLNEEQMLSDLLEVTDSLRARFHQDKIYIVGHSFGTYLGLLAVQRRPEAFRAYIGVGQIARRDQWATVQDEFIRESATKAGDQRALQELPQATEFTRKKLVVRFGGDLYGKSRTWPMALWALRAPEYSWADFYHYLVGLVAFVDYPAFYQVDPARSVSRVDIPVYFFLGRHDYACPSLAAQSYFASLKSPGKRIVWFENSGHWPFIEETRKFAAEMRQVRAETNTH
jgi:pimeloyl-ACP methyl ester carboxylesterase